MHKNRVAVLVDLSNQQTDQIDISRYVDRLNISSQSNGRYHLFICFEGALSVRGGQPLKLLLEES